MKNYRVINKYSFKMLNSSKIHFSDLNFQNLK